jgi:hypothetical protein
MRREATGGDDLRAVARGVTITAGARASLRIELAEPP